MVLIRRLAIVAFLSIMTLALAQVSFAIDVKVMPDTQALPNPSYAWVSRNLPVWGNVTGGTAPYTYVWDFGDGSPNASGVVGDPRHILVGHTYGTAGTYFATLTVTDILSASDSATVRIRVEPVSTLKTQVEAAIQDGLRYLYLTQRTDGSWYGSPHGSGAYVGGAGMAVLAFEKKGYYEDGGTIFADTVARGLDYLFSRSYVTSIDAASDEHNSNGKGASIYYGRVSYETPIAMMAIVASGTPGKIITTGAYAGQTYQYLVEEATDWCAYAQTDSGNARGGWRYTANSGADNSVSQWPAIGLEAAETDWGITAPAFVKDRLINGWLAYSQHGTNGGFGYTYSGNPNMARSAGGFCELAYCDLPVTDARVQNVLGYLANGWSWTGYNGNRGNLYAMYGVAKGARISLPAVTMIGTRDWQDDYNNWLVADQNYTLNGGSWWSNSSHGNTDVATSWAVLVLSAGITTLVPVADAGPDQDMPPGDDVTFDGTGSYHQDPNKSIVLYEWDVDNDGTYDLTGSQPTLVGGYPDTGADYSETVTLRVTDEDGVQDTDTMKVNITSQNVPPIADAGGPYFGQVGQPITFDGSGSYDPNEPPDPLNDSIVLYEWDLDGDGQYDDATGVTATKTWNTPHSGSIGLKVTDSYGLSDTASAEYTTVAVSELWIVEYRWSSQVDPPYEFLFEPDGVYMVARMDVRMENRGTGDAENVTASLVDTAGLLPDYVTVLDGDLTFGSVPAGSSVWSVDHFEIKTKVGEGSPYDTVWWDIEWDDSLGSHHLMQNVPMFGP
jgi:hypothetical protein